MRLLIATGKKLPPAGALALGGYVAQRLDLSLTVLSVIRRERDRPAAEALLAQAVETLSSWTQTVRIRMRVGQVVQEIVREAKEGGYELVIVGEQKHPRLVSRFLPGSTATRVVEQSPCPAIVAKGKIGPIQKLLLCLGRIDSHPVVDWFVAQLSGLVTGEEKITVLHVMSQISAGPGVKGSQLRASARELIDENSPEGRLLENSLQALTKWCADCRLKVRHGLVVDEIMREAQSGDYDLVIIGAHPGEGWRRFLLTNLARQIIARLDRPVLVIQSPSSSKSTRAS